MGERLPYGALHGHGGVELVQLVVEAHQGTVQTEGEGAGAGCAGGAGARGQWTERGARAA